MISDLTSLISKGGVFTVEGSSTTEIYEKVCNLIKFPESITSDAVFNALCAREKIMSTAVGNGIALPHGVEEAKKAVIHSGIAVMAFPEGTNWGEEDVKLVVGVAGVGEEHLMILANIAEKLSTPEAVERLVAGTADDVYSVFMGGNQ